MGAAKRSRAWSRGRSRAGARVERKHTCLQEGEGKVKDARAGSKLRRWGVCMGVGGVRASERRATVEWFVVNWVTPAFSLAKRRLELFELEKSDWELDAPEGGGTKSDS